MRASLNVYFRQSTCQNEPSCERWWFQYRVLHMLTRKRHGLTITDKRRHVQHELNAPPRKPDEGKLFTMNGQTASTMYNSLLGKAIPILGSANSVELLCLSVELRGRARAREPVSKQGRELMVF